MPETPLMELCHGGGCGCKVSPGALAGLLGERDPAQAAAYPNLLVGRETSDDCGVWQVSDDQLLVSSADFFMPVVNDPHDFGRIAATNALSDIYAMGAQPVFALALVGMPLDKLAPETIAAILAGGESACADAGVPVAGGHTIDSAEPIYGLSVNGLCAPSELCRNDTARPGDVVLLGKPLGVGVLSAALRKGELGGSGRDALVGTTTMLNKPGRAIACAGLATAMTDVTGFGLLGHLLEMCRGAGVRAIIDWPSVPLLAPAVELAQAGFATGASERNWRSYGEQVRLDGGKPWQRALLTDPQTSGGLLVACDESSEERVRDAFAAEGFESVARVGKFEAGEPGVAVNF